MWDISTASPISITEERYTDGFEGVR